MNHFPTIPGGAGGGSGSGSASASTHASMEGTASAASHAERPSSAAASSLPFNPTSDSHRHGLGLFNGDSHSSPASQSSASLYHQHQSGRPAPPSHQNQHPPQQSYVQNQQPQQQQSQQHHRQQTASISSTSNFRYESTDSGLTPSFSSNTIVYSSPSFVNDPSETASQSVHASTPVSTNASSQVLIASIVQRLVNKLPCNSGWRLQVVEEDDLVRSCVVNLINLSRFQLGFVVKELLGAIELLVKQSSQQRLEHQAGIGMLHSQLFILKVLVSCFNHQWRIAEGVANTARPGLDLLSSRSSTNGHDDDGNGQLSSTTASGWTDPPPMDDTQAKHVLSVMTLLIKQNVARDDPMFASTHEGVESRPSSKSDPAAASAMAGRNAPSERSLRDLSLRDATSSGFSAGKAFSPHTSSRLARERDDQDAREDASAAGLGDKLSEVFMPSSLCLATPTSLHILYPCFPPTRSPFDTPPSIDYADLASAAAAAAAAEAAASPDAAKASKSEVSDISPTAKFNASSWTTTAFSPDVEGFDTSSNLQTRIYRLASQVVFHLSSSNWVVVNARLRNRLYYLSSTIEEAPSTAELRLLECSNFQRSRLANILQEVGTSFPQLKRSAQYTIALTLRRAIWSWIQYHPAEFVSLATNNRRFEGSPDVVFDQVYALADNTKRKIAFWPLLTSLLILCPDLVGRAAVGENRKASGSLAKKLSFIDGLRKSPRNPALVDTATLCCVDLFKAAATVPRSENGLRLIVHDLEAELKERLFDPKRPLASGNKPIELTFMIDLFAALFRLDPQRTIRELVPVCMSHSSPVHFKTALVKACVLLASERHRVPWAPDVSLLYPHISRSLRAFLRETVFRLPRFDDRDIARKRAASRSASSSQFRNISLSVSAAAAATSVEELGRLELLQSILQLWTLDISALAHGIDHKQDSALSSLSGGTSPIDRETVFSNAVSVDSTLGFTAALCALFATPAEFATFRKSFAALLGRVYHSGLIDSRFADFCNHQRRAAVSCLPFFFTIITKQLMSADSSEMQRHYLDLLRRSQQRRGFFISQDKDWQITVQASFYPTQRERKLEYVWVQLVTLLMMCSSDTEVCSSAMQCAREHAQLTTAISDYYDPLSEEWLRLYTDLADPSFLHTGRIAQQKRIRALLRDIESPSTASWLAWKQAYARWSSFIQLVARPIAEDSLTAQDKAAQWHNYAGFLCAFGGACFSASDIISSHIEPSIAKILPQFSSPDKHPAALVERFVQEMVDLLVSDSLWVREKAKETLGVDLGARLVGILFRQIHAVLSDFFDKETGYPKTSDMYTVFVEQSIGVVTMVLNRLDETRASSSTSKVDIGSLMVLFVEYANSLVRDEQALRIKTAMCQMCEILMRKKEAFSFSNELRVRNRLFQALTTWTSDGAEDGSTSSSVDPLDRLHRELDVACLKCISILLDKLPLLLADDALLLDDKVEGAKTRHFAMYFGYFLKILNRTRHIEAATTVRTRALTDAKPIAGAKSIKADVSRDLVPIRESAIVALSNLLASNIDSGLHSSLPLAYNEDPRIRTAFMQIMTNVLSQGTAFDELERMSAARKSTRLVDLVCQDDLQLALTICQVCPGRDVEPMSVLLLSMFDAKGGLIRFLKAAVEEEIQRTATEEMVFRSNSFCTTLLSTFARTHGYDYLRSIMAPLITEFARKPAGFSVEMDPSRVEPGGSVLKNQSALEDIAQTFIDAICSSAHRVPAVLRELCRHIRTVLDARFPASRYQGVGGLMFLRFISPAVVSPHMIDINLTGPSKDLRRGLVLISKILITLASNNLFSGHKEPFMTGLNDFLKSNVWKVTAFLDQVSDARTDPDRIYAADQPLGFGIHPNVYGIDDRDHRILHRFLFDHVDKIGKHLADRTADSVAAHESLSAYDSKRQQSGDAASLVYDDLCDALAVSGEPKGEDLPEPSFSAGNYQDFIRRHAGRNIDEESYRDIFYEGPASRSGRPVLYYSMHKQKADTIDFEGLILYILQTLETFAYRQFDIVFDTTACHPLSVTPSQWLLYFSSLIPAPILANVVNVLFVNPNTTARVELQFWSTATYSESALKHEIADRLTSMQNVVHCSTLSSIETWIELRNLALDRATMSILNSPVETIYDQVTLVWYYRTLTPVTFIVGSEYLQIQGLKQQDWLPNVTVQLNDVFHLSDIDDVRSISIRGDDNTFFLSCRNGSMNFVFNSRERSEVVQALRQAKARVSKFRASNAVDRVLRPNDVPGTLLNMAMLNITSNDAALRLSAYNLLCALSTSFNFGASSAKKRLLSSRGLTLPANTMAFVTDLSKDFAVAAPGVTLEFLLSFFDGFDRAAPSQKTVCLHYLSPWLSNLVMFVHSSREQLPENHRRIKEILNQLISITTKQPDMYGVMQRCVWSQLGRLDDLVSTFLDVFTEAAMDSGLHTERFEAVLDTMVSFGSINLRGKLLSRLRKVVAKTAQNPVVSQLHLNASWKEIATLMRMNMVLSFTNRVETLLYLPELLHVILLLAGNGVDATRHSIYGSAINLVHSLCTEDPREARKPEEAMPRSVEAVAKLRVLLERLAEPESLKLFGLPVASQVGGSSAASATSQAVVRETPDNASIERLATLMYEVADVAAPNTDAANSWRARLASLVTSTAFQYNPIIQSRAFVLLGCLAQGEIDDDLLYQILVSLRGSIAEWASSSADMPMISIVTCLSKVVKILPTRSRYLPQMFWLGIAMVQCGHVPLFKAGVELMHATVDTIWERDILASQGNELISYLLDARFEFRDLACKLDDETGVDFDINFSFGMAALLVKGLRHPTTKEVTTQLMQAMLHHCGVDGQGERRSQSGRISERQLGFFVGLLPTATRPEEFGELLSLAGVEASACQAAVEARRSGYKGLQEYLDVLNNRIALLLVTLVASLLQHAESDAERLLLYGFLNEAAREVPAIVSILYDSLAPSMKDIFVNCSNGAILDAVHGIAQTAVSQPLFAAQARETAKRGGPNAYLAESGYGSLLGCGAFVPLMEGRRHVLCKLSIQLVLGLTDVGTT
ncbi:RasGAP group protein [Pseudozyma hubeiensis SY62]|uniref:RasGAP group protein n=1 Tax=Pseudozyma hubeiensis (strain SY62) TaxID=1305764 RepID=R9P6U5_PSEHS|nr:RasGAP group protein [Pseudozyma hubeiensis SY62]GAC96962.1 RasGAP group protein [Pseudozyma hubeiensis SY62]